MTVDAKLGERVDAALLAPEFRLKNRLHIPDFFNAEFATAVHEALIGDVPWMRTMVLQGKGVEVSLNAFLAAGQRRLQLEAEVANSAQSGFQYSYDSYRLSDQLKAGRRIGGNFAPVEAVYDFLNSAVFLAFVRQLTDDQAPDHCDAHVTRYCAGHFLNRHHDGNTDTGRLYAYVLNLTPMWQTNWGGVLLFQDEAQNVITGYPPRFNALNVFRVPQWHSVSQVASFVRAHRYSITGWVRTAPVSMPES
jgi:SM-20-related protein